MLSSDNNRLEFEYGKDTLVEDTLTSTKPMLIAESESADGEYVKTPP